MAKRLLLALLLFGLSTMVRAQDFGLDVGSSSPPFTFSTTVSPTPDGGGIFDFVNNNPFAIETLVFDTNIGAGNESFNGRCSMGGFFQSCADNYNIGTGDLTITFSGLTAPPNDDLGNPCDPEIGEKEGIPSAVGCDNNAGHFLINLNDGFVTTGDTGSWHDNTFTVQQINNQVVPEPVPLPMLGIALLGLATLGRRKVWRRD